MFHKATAPAFSRVPVGASAAAGGDAQPTRPLFGPAAAIEAGPESLVDAGPLYAGECVDRISDVRPAGELVSELAP